MYRRVVAAAGAAGLLAVALPALPALAAAASTVSLDAADVEVLPTAGEVFDITVANTEGMALLGGGRTIDYVRVILPSEVGIRTLAALPVKEGWKAIRVSQNGLERLDFKATGGGLAPRTSTSFPIPAEVLAPLAADRSGAFQVGVSSDGGATFQTATGNLSTTIRTLQVQTLRVVDGPGQVVADGTGTAGQTISTVVAVKNFAREAQQVTPNLASTGGGTPADAVGAITPAQVAAGAVGQFTIPVTLGKVASDATRSFTAGATGTPAVAGRTGSSTTGTGDLRQAIGYVVQAAPTFNLLGASFAPKAVNGRTSYEFTVDGAKSGSPALSLPSGELVLTPRTEPRTAVAPIALKEPVSFAAGSATGRFTFVSTLLDPELVRDGRYDAGFTFTGVDGNGFAPEPASLVKTLADILSVDNLGPVVTTVVTLPTDRDGDRTTAARDYVAGDGNAITVSGTADDGAASLGRIALQCVTGGQVIDPVGTPSITRNGGSLSYSARFEPVFTDCSTFQAVASFRDAALNVGEQFSAGLVEVDNQVPTIDGLLGAVARYDGVDPEKSSVMVNIGDNLTSSGGTQTGVIGGCDPRAYSVDGQLLVQGVYVLEGGEFRECTTGLMNGRAEAKPVNNERYLRLTSDIARGSELPEPTISYDPARSGLVPDRLKDAAGNYAPAGLQDTVNRLVPAAPVLLTATRNGGSETAVNDGGTFFTRFSGASDFVITVAGALAGDTFQVLQGETVVASAATSEGEAVRSVPVAATEGAVQTFSLRFVSAQGVLGDRTPLEVVFDITAPTAAATQRLASGDAEVTFAEPVLGGNQAVNWSVFEFTKDEEGNDVRAFRGVNSVTGDREVRTLSADFTGPSARYGGALYTFLDGTRYEDFAGNRLAETTEVLAQ